MYTNIRAILQEGYKYAVQALALYHNMSALRECSHQKDNYVLNMQIRQDQLQEIVLFLELLDYSTLQCYSLTINQDYVEQNCLKKVNIYSPDALMDSLRQNFEKLIISQNGTITFNLYSLAFFDNLSFSIQLSKTNKSKIQILNMRIAKVEMELKQSKLNKKVAQKECGLTTKQQQTTKQSIILENYTKTLIQSFKMNQHILDKLNFQIAKLKQNMAQAKNTIKQSLQSELRKGLAQIPQIVAKQLNKNVKKQHIVRQQRSGQINPYSKSKIQVGMENYQNKVQKANTLVQNYAKSLQKLTFAADLKGKKLKIFSPTVAGKKKGTQQRLLLLQPQLKTKRTWKVKIHLLMCQGAIGIADLDIVRNNQFKIIQTHQTGHGMYFLHFGRSIWSSYQEQINRKKLGFPYTTGDTIRITYDPEVRIISFQKEGVDKICSFYVSPHHKHLHAAVALWSKNDLVEIIQE